MFNKREISTSSHNQHILFVISEDNFTLSFVWTLHFSWSLFSEAFQQISSKKSSLKKFKKMLKEQPKNFKSRKSFIE